MNIKDVDKLSYTLSEIDFTSKKTFIMGRVNSGKTHILAKILSGINKTTKTLFIGTDSRLDKLYRENQPDCSLLDEFSDKTIINLGDYKTRRISEDYEVQKKEVIPAFLDSHLIVHDEIFKPSESINNLFKSENRNVGYITEVNVGQNVMLGLVKTDLEDAVVFLVNLLSENNLNFSDVPELQVILLDELHELNKNTNKIERCNCYYYYNSESLGDIANSLQVEKPEIFRKINFEARSQLIDISNRTLLDEIKNKVDNNRMDNKLNALLEECLQLSSEWGTKIGLDDFKILKSINIITCDGQYLNTYYPSRRHRYQLIEDAENEIARFKQKIEKYQLLMLNHQS